ncbi:MAG: sigma-70 family RNA polymerase sigma factor [Kiritimatiellae bacterium]|nr:sigma-70 family RNA polymerase sigma factor [Kiritimatiellia bacterium]MDW8459389.1 sigma-70 family RNA polymerase sigma factor [Verrucomicrobiota bacterium]
MTSSSDPFIDNLERIAERLYRIGLGFCGSHADAQDMVQETILSAYRHRAQFEGRSDIHTWLYRIASRVCMRMRRRRAGQPARFESIDEDPAFAERMIVDLDELARRSSEGHADPELLEQLKESILKLPEPFRLVLVLKEIAGLSIDETARVLGIKPQTVKTRLHRARMRLRARLAKKLPTKPGVAPLYSRQVCLDLLKAKQAALDRGEPFPVQNSLMCERCRSVFATLDLEHDLCQRLGEAPAPLEIREFIRRLESEVKSTPAKGAATSSH